MIKSAPAPWRESCSKKLTTRKKKEKKERKRVPLVFRPSAPPAGRSEGCIWLRSRRKRRGMLPFSSALWRSGAKIADSSSIRTSSRSTHSPLFHIVPGLMPSLREKLVAHSRCSPTEAGRDRHPLHGSLYR